MVGLEVVVRVVGIVLEALPVTRVPVLAVVVLVALVVGVVVLLAPLPLVAFEGVVGGIDALELVREIAGIGFIVDFV